MTTLGQVLLAISALAAFASIGSLVWGHFMGPKEGEGLTNAGYLSTFVVFATTTLSVVVLVTAFFRKDFTFLYVAENHSTDVSSLSWLYSISGLWAGREGSLLFWAWILSGFASWMAYKRLAVTDALSNIGLAITNFVQLFFLAALFIPTNNPFNGAIVAADGTISTAAGQIIGDVGKMAMSPLLQHWAMIIHPPTLFIGYAGLTIPFAWALAAVFLGDGSKRWVELVDRVTLFSWLLLGIGIGLGSIWAYVVLGWGGYWAWDPVENASLLPWLIGVGLLHSFTVYKRRDGFKMWAVMMSAIAFVFVLLGTFITRSGVITSVHAFQEDPISLWLFLSMMVGSLAVAGVSLYARRAAFRGNDDFTSIVSKNGSYYFNNVFMLLGAMLVAAMTMAPALKGPTFSAAAFDLLARPIGILYALIMAVCPILSWNATDPKTFWSRAKWPLGGAAAISAGLLAIWATVMLPVYEQSAKGLPALKGIQPIVDHTEAVIGLLVASLCIALPIYLFIDGARKRSAAQGQGFFPALGSILVKARTQSGGYITHLGIGIILIGLIGSSIYVRDVQFFLKEQPGAKQSIAGYDIIFRGFTDTTLPNGDVVSKARVDLQQGGRLVANLTPGMTVFANRPENQSRVLNAAVNVQPLRDVFVVFQGTDTAGLSFDVKVNPMISWTWAGFIILILGTVLAMWPKRERELAPAPAPGKKKKAA
jgi:cytochrome c-type biogenesis protein CcmF